VLLLEIEVRSPSILNCFIGLYADPSLTMPLLVHGLGKVLWQEDTGPEMPRLEAVVAHFKVEDGGRLESRSRKRKYKSRFSNDETRVLTCKGKRLSL
jgi:hypothetical protein